MLTKQDLNQLRQIIREEVQKEIDPLKEDIKILKKNVSLIKLDVKALREDVDNIQSNIISLKKDTKTIKSDVKKITKDINTIVSYFDNEYLLLNRKVERIEKHLKLSSIPSS